MNFFFEPSASWLTFLVTYLFQSTIILGTGYLAVMIWKARAVTERYRLLSWTLVISIVMPAVLFWLPMWNILPSGLSKPVTTQLSSVISTIQSQTLLVENSPAYLMTLMLIVWLTGVLWMLLRVLVGQLTTHKLINNGLEITDDELTELIQSSGSSRSIRLMRSNRAVVPFTIGLIRPVIVVPDQFESWTTQQKRMVLLHELAHIIRKDAPVHTLLVILNSMIWFNPFIWLVLSRLRQLSEEACDEMVLISNIKPSDYADHLLHILQDIKNQRSWGLSGATMTNKSFKHLGGRIMKILTDRPVTGPARTMRVVWLVTMLLSSVLVLGSFQTEAGDKLVPSKTEITKKVLKIDYKLPAPDDFVKLTTPPEMVKEATPDYPETAQKKKIEGDVWVKVLILKDGTVHEALIHKSSGNKLLDNSAIMAAKKNLFKPGLQEKKPVAFWVTYKVTFMLGDEEKKEEKEKKDKK